MTARSRIRWASRSGCGKGYDGDAPAHPSAVAAAGRRGARPLRCGPAASLPVRGAALRVDRLPRRRRQRGRSHSDAVTTRSLAQFFDWLKGSGWTAVSLDDLAAAGRGTRPLPAKAILVTFDDGYRSLYTRVFPLLKVYRFPIVAALSGDWMEGEAGGTVDFGGDRRVPRSNFISWAEAREMQASGLVEFGSHSYRLHRGMQANPQGSSTPAAVTWRYDPATG